MPNRLLVALLVVQTLTLLVLAADRLVPVAHAADATRCEIANWPDALTGQGYATIRVKLEGSDTIPITVKGWQTYDRVKVEP